MKPQPNIRLVEKKTPEQCEREFELTLAQFTAFIKSQKEALGFQQKQAKVGN